MSDKISIPEKKSVSLRDKINPDIPGKITRQIGSGKYAQAAIAWHTIKWCFITGLILTTLQFISSVFIQSKPFSLEDVKGFWSVIIPIVTLVLGYMFGKGKE